MTSDATRPSLKTWSGQKGPLILRFISSQGPALPAFRRATRWMAAIDSRMPEAMAAWRMKKRERVSWPITPPPSIRRLDSSPTMGTVPAVLEATSTSQ